MDIRESSLLTPIKDPATGVTSYQLENPGRIQNNYYFTVPSTTADDRYLSIVSTHPGDREQNIWLADFEKNTLRPVTTKGFAVESMILDEERGKIWYAQNGAVYGQAIEDTEPDRGELLFTFPEEIAKGRPVVGFSNHITYNHDGSRFAFCGSVDGLWYIGFYDLREKAAHIVHTAVGKATHVQYAPDASNNILFCHDWWISPETGRYYDWDHRLWLYEDASKTVRPVYLIEHAPNPNGGHKPFHEFWSRDGKAIYLCDMPQGVVRHDPKAPESFELVWPGAHCHAHCNAKGTRFVSDINPYGWPRGENAQVAYCDTETGREGYIARNLPPAPIFSCQRQYDRHYHPHPHPSFSASENYVNYTSTMDGGLNVRLAFAEDIFG